MDDTDIKCNLIMDILSQIKNNDRKRIFELIEDKYCLCCGEKQPEHYRCQCDNDE